MGSLEDNMRTGCPHSVCTEENIQQIAQAFIETTTQSAREVIQELDISDHSLWLIMKGIALKVYRPCSL